MSLDPQVAQWYQHQDSGEIFKVVAVDPATGGIEVQSFDASIEEIDPDVWEELDLEAIEAPEDWSGPYDELPSELQHADVGAAPRDWRVSLERQEPPEAWRSALELE